MLLRQLIRPNSSIHAVATRPFSFVASLQSKSVIDYSRVPKLNEEGLSEKFVRGSGPGRSRVNKNPNCVALTHFPSGNQRRLLSYSHVWHSKVPIDYSRVPVIKEEDLEEKFVRGSGPGGSAVNKNSNCVVLTHLPSGNQRRLLSYSHVWHSKVPIDYSLVPVIKEEDLEEKFVRGSGPGGQAVNKNSNCDVLTHVPSGNVVKCHLSRSQDVNRKLAREMLVARLDDEINGELSVKSQLRAAQDQKSGEQNRKSRLKRDMKNKWKEREGIS